MAIPKGMGKSAIGARKAAKKGATSKGTIGVPAPDTTTPPSTTPTPPSTPSTPSGDGKNWVKPKSYDTPFTPIGVPNDDNWHHDDQHIVSEHLMNYGKQPLDVVRYWMQNDGEALKRATPFDPQHGDYNSFDFTKVGNPHPDGPVGYAGDVGSPAPKAKAAPPKPSGDQHAGAYVVSSAEAIRNMPGSYASGITNGMTNRDKYVK